MTGKKITKNCGFYGFVATSPQLKKIAGESGVPLLLSPLPYCHPGQSTPLVPPSYATEYTLLDPFAEEIPRNARVYTFRQMAHQSVQVIHMYSNYRKVFRARNRKQFISL